MGRKIGSILAAVPVPESTKDSNSSGLGKRQSPEPQRLTALLAETFAMLSLQVRDDTMVVSQVRPVTRSTTQPSVRDLSYEKPTRPSPVLLVSASTSRP